MFSQNLTRCLRTLFDKHLTSKRVKRETCMRKCKSYNLRFSFLIHIHTMNVTWSFIFISHQPLITVFSPPPSLPSRTSDYYLREVVVLFLAVSLAVRIFINYLNVPLHSVVWQLLCVFVWGFVCAAPCCSNSAVLHPASTLSINSLRVKQRWDKFRWEIRSTIIGRVEFGFLAISGFKYGVKTDLEIA